MKKQRGSFKNDVQNRIEAMAYAVVMGASDDYLRDPTDINDTEEEEIVAAHHLAEAWASGNFYARAKPTAAMLGDRS